MNSVSHLSNSISAYVGNSAVGFGETVRTTIFSAVLRSDFVREKDWSWRFALNFCFFLFKQKENYKAKLTSYYSKKSYE